ncbi:hypothetical protein THRCLA_11275 [Thraustotheca clavata]|uniref:Exonuclease domain-containing protein n=1 Tax=Thraustotheca clavata TaxID=74557 RepID=A0A1V9Y8B5_9STRA|nr:hypothetical protein THRCLA_11275 [Thraustotheca clavata]
MTPKTIADEEPRAKKAKTEESINRTYDDLVAMTQHHPDFKKDFVRPPNTICTQTMKKSSKAKYKKIVAMDCEMCVIMNETTKEKNGKALARVSVVDGENPDEILVDLIVHQPPPGWIVTQYKQMIHGILPEVIDSSKIEPERARKEVLKYIGPDTIVVGHSVFFDLACIGIYHTKVIDTAFIFSRKEVEDAQGKPSLRDLTSQLLELDMPGIHDSYLDAKMSMLAANYALTNACGQVIVNKRRLEIFEEKRAIKAAEKELEQTNAEVRLVVHRIPKGIFNTDVEKFFVSKSSVVPTMVENIVFSNFGSCNAYFRSEAHALLAFNTIQGAESKDPSGRPFKLVKIPTRRGKLMDKIKVMIAKK